jgi:hypothetical protein
MMKSIDSKLQALNSIYNPAPARSHHHHQLQPLSNGLSSHSAANGSNHIRKSPKIPALPKIESHESSIDVSLLDVMAMDDFLSLLKNKTDSNWKELWKETCIFTKQLKAARELLSIGSNLISNRSNRKILDRLLEVTHVLLNAERVLIFEIDRTSDARELVVTYANEEKLLGTRIPALTGLEGKSSYSFYGFFNYSFFLSFFLALVYSCSSLSLSFM